MFLNVALCLMIKIQVFKRISLVCVHALVYFPCALYYQTGYFKTSLEIYICIYISIFNQTFAFLLQSDVLITVYTCVCVCFVFINVYICVYIRINVLW